MASENNKFAISNLFNVEGWVCVVTGGGTGIGLVIAQAFANNGAKVYITSRRREVLERTEKEWRSSFPHLQGKLIPVVCDITSKDSIRRLVDEIGKKEDHVDLLVNNAGSLGSKESETQGKNVEALARDLFDDDPAQWEDIYKTNVIGAYFVSTAFLPLLHAATKRRHNHTGCIINISSIAGITRHPLDHIKYNASKAAFIQLSTMLAQICRSEAVQIRVNNIAPGRFPTAMTGEHAL